MRLQLIISGIQDHIDMRKGIMQGAHKICTVLVSFHALKLERDSTAKIALDITVTTKLLPTQEEKQKINDNL